MLACGMQNLTDSPSFSFNRGATGTALPVPRIDEDELPWGAFPDFSDRPEVEFVPPSGLLLQDLD